MGLLDSFVEGMVEGTKMDDAEKKELIDKLHGIEHEVLPAQDAEVYTLSANKGYGGFKNYKTKVVLDAQGNCTVSTDKTTRSFAKKDVVKAEFKFTPKLTFMDIIRYAIAVALCFFYVPVGLLLGAASFIVSLLKTLVLTLKDGSKVKIYYKNKAEAQALANKILVQ